MFRNGLLTGKRVLITGGGTGLGKAIGHGLAALGADLVICGRRAEVLRAAAADIASASGRQVEAVPCDIRDAAEVETMMDEIWATGPLDVLINNAAANFLARTETLSPRAFDAIMRVSVNGAAYCTISVGRRWIGAGRGGVILNVLASGVESGRAFMVPLTMAKSAMLAMTRSLAVEWGRKGIRCVAVAPGAFPTEASAERLQPLGRPADRSRAIPLGRLGELPELSGLCAFLVSDLAAYITGEMISVDGGGSLMRTEVNDLLDWTPEQWEALKPKPVGPAAAKPRP